MTAYQRLEDHFRTLMLLGEVEGILHWDTSTMMPSGSAHARGEQMAAIRSVRHEMLISMETCDLLDRAAIQDDLDGWQQANLREMRRSYNHAAALDKELVTALSKATNACEIGWRTARYDNDYRTVRPLLAEVLNLVRQSAEAKSENLGCAPYDALLDQYAPGLRMKTVDSLFDKLAVVLPDLSKSIIERQLLETDPKPPTGPFPVDQQRRLGVKLMQTLGFNFDGGRLDESIHPFSGGTPDDLRITNRYDENDFMSGLMGVLHETGHALYEKGLPKKWRRQPVGMARGMDIHESQSLLIEMQACRSLEFLTFASPLLQETFERAGPEWKPENLYRICTRVQPGLIRVDADEVTYPLHVILRYRLEIALLSETLSLDDLPDAWNMAMSQLLDLTPSNDQDGCLQDIHWFDGAFGYFPSYTFGAIIAAQLFMAAKKEDNTILSAIQLGDFKPLFVWLIKHVHGLGSLLEAPDMITLATGSKLDADIFLNHLQHRYMGT